LVCIKRDVTREVQLEKQLQHAQKMEAIGTLAGGIAHDFNNILGGIQGFTELCLQKVPKGEERLQRNLRHILEGCERAKDLIHHILSFGRKNDEKNKPIEIQLVVRQALKLLRASIPSTITIDQKLDGDHSIVCTTPTHIHQIVMNLCANAAQAMEETGGTLEVVLQNTDLSEEQCSSKFNAMPGPYVLVKITDSGKGIPPDVVERIFEPYFTTKPQSGGTGLGLSVVHSIVSKLKGLIQVSTAVNEGTTFEIYLPRIEDQVHPTCEELCEPPHGQEKILVVDDEVFILEIMRELLGTLGYEVDTAESGHEALEFLRRNPRKYDLIIADQVMPKMTGRQLTEAATHLAPNLPVIICTGLGMGKETDDTNGDKVQTILTKPIKYWRLASTVRHVLDAKESDPYDQH
jgi:nitrogen-specific signal transduction histidine kinase